MPLRTEMSWEPMRVEVYEGGNGHVVLCQGWPELAGEKYLRIIINLKDAETVAEEILALAKRMRRK
jgi:hypothetical protein